MDITWLGHSAIRVRTRSAAVVMEPAARSEGVEMGRPAAAIVTVSHDHPAHAHAAGVRGDPVVLRRPGDDVVQDGIAIRVERPYDGTPCCAAIKQPECPARVVKPRRGAS